MSKISKRQKIINEKIVTTKQYDVNDALCVLKDCSKVKFTESVDVSVNLGIDPRKSDQLIRGSVVLPHGTGRSIRVAVLTEGDNVQAATLAGADVVGFEDLAEQIKQGVLDFELLIATPDAMRRFGGQLGKILGQRGLMPNPKVGTVTNDVANAVKNAKAGQVQYKTDKGGIVHCTIGKINFETQALKDNLLSLISEIKRAKPSAVKGVYLKKIVLSSTMGPGVAIDQATLSA